MGLEYTQENITQDLDTIRNHDQFTGISFEHFGIDKNGGLSIPTTLSDVWNTHRSVFKGEGYPMISTYPHTKESMGYVVDDDVEHHCCNHCTFKHHS